MFSAIFEGGGALSLSLSLSLSMGETKLEPSRWFGRSRARAFVSSFRSVGREATRWYR